MPFKMLIIVSSILHYSFTFPPGPLPEIMFHCIEKDKLLVTVTRSVTVTHHVLGVASSVTYTYEGYK